MSVEVITTLPLPPTWAAVTHRHDEGREFTAAVGHVRPADGRTFPVELVQTEYCDFKAQPATVRREPPQVRIVGHRYSLDQAADLVLLIDAALQLSGRVDYDSDIAVSQATPS